MSNRVLRSGLLAVLGLLLFAAPPLAHGNFMVVRHPSVVVPPANCASWEEVQPNPGNWYHQESYDDNQDGMISICDEIELEIQPGGDRVWYHVEDVSYIGSYVYVELTTTWRLFLDIDPPLYEWRIDPDPSCFFDVYVCMDCFGAPPADGTRGTGFLFERTFEGFKLSQTSLMGGLGFGDVEVDGWTIAAGADCVYPDESGVACIGVVQYLYLGVGGYIQLHPHPGTGKEVLDCDFGSGHYCIYGNLGVWQDPPPGEVGCDCEEPSPVSPTTWGRIKAQYK